MNNSHFIYLLAFRAGAQTPALAVADSLFTIEESSKAIYFFEEVSLVRLRLILKLPRYYSAKQNTQEETKMKRFPSIIIIILFVLLQSCNADDDNLKHTKLPEITAEGAHTLGCRINGEIFLPKDDESCVSFDCLPVSELRMSYVRNGEQYQLSLIARNNINGNVSINLDLYLNEPLQEQVYELSESYIATIDKVWPNASSCIYQRIDGEDLNSCFATNSDFTGTIEITEINESDRFIAGFFRFQAVNQQGKIVEFTDGRFDILIYYTNVF